LAESIGMTVKVQSVRRDFTEPITFSCVDLNTGRVFSCRPSLRFMQTHPLFDVNVGDELRVEDFIRDLITGEVGPILVPEFIQKLPSGSTLEVV
jgi:hypothetical protein